MPGGGPPEREDKSSHEQAQFQVNDMLAAAKCIIIHLKCVGQPATVVHISMRVAACHSSNACGSLPRVARTCVYLK